MIVNDEDDIFEKIKSEDEDRQIETATTYKIISYGADYTLSVLNTKLVDKDIFVPPFQRKYIWSVSKASKLIESFLMGLPVPQIFLYKEIETEKLLVVDGQQRLKSIQYFFNGKFPNGRKFKLKHVKPEWVEKTFNDLSDADQRRLEDSILRATIFQQTDPNDNSSIFEVFERLNTGGMTLNSQEIRNCIIRGKINTFLNELNKYPNWRNLFSKDDEHDRRMRDIEMILRFLALFDRFENYSEPMKDFLTEFMREKKDLNENERIRYKEIFEKTMDIISSKIGLKAFRIRAGLNIAVFDAISVAIARTSLKNLDNIFGNYHVLIKDSNFVDLVSAHTTDKETVKTRIKMAIGAFSK